MNSTYSDVRLERMEAMRVASCCIISRNPEAQAASYLKTWAEERGIAGARSFGFDYPVSDEQRQQGFRGYECWIVVPDSVTESEGIIIKDVPGCEYAVLRVNEPFSDPWNRIPAGWQELHDWVSKSEYAGGAGQDRYWLEEVVEDDEGHTYMDLYYPIT